MTSKIKTGQKFQKTNPRTLPGDAPYMGLVRRMARVNQAGEMAAKEIYRGQLAILSDHKCAPLLEEMAEHEAAHLDAFNTLLTEVGARPSALSPLWRAAGYALGAGSALLSERAAMVTTIAVEEVIEDHYQKQLDELSHYESNPETKGLHTMISTFRNDEIEHGKLAENFNSKKQTGNLIRHKLLKCSIKKGTRIAIWLAERV